MGDYAVIEQKRARGDIVDEFEIMGDQKDRPALGDSAVAELFEQAAAVEITRQERFIENGEKAPGSFRAGKTQKGLLARRERKRWPL